MIYLTKIGVKDQVKEKIYCEKMGVDFLLISICIENEESVNPLYYWQLDGIVKEKNLPPLEIAVNIDNGKISNITFFVDSYFEGNIEKKLMKKEYGNIIIDKKIFENNFNYIRNDKSYRVIMDENNLICMFDFISTEYFYQYISDNFAFLIDYDNHICGFCIDNFKYTKMLESINI